MEKNAILLDISLVPSTDHLRDMVSQWRGIPETEFIRALLRIISQVWLDKDISPKNTIPCLNMPSNQELHHQETQTPKRGDQKQERIHLVRFQYRKHTRKRRRDHPLRRLNHPQL